MRMRFETQTHPLMDNALCKVGENVLECLDDFFLTSGGRHPSLMELPFAIQEIQWERMQQEKIYVHGFGTRLQQVSFEIDLWRLELPKGGKPKVVVHQVSGPWYVQTSSTLTTLCLLFSSKLNDVSSHNFHDDDLTEKCINEEWGLLLRE